MRSGDVALRLLAVFSMAGFIALAASLYEVDRREKSNSGTAAVNLIEIEQQVQVLSNQIRILSNHWAPTSDRLSCSIAKSKPSICG